MPKRKRPGLRRDVNETAHAIVQAMIGEGPRPIPPSERTEKNPEAVRRGRKGGKARHKALAPAQRSEIARHAAETRWGKGPQAVTTFRDRLFTAWHLHHVRTGTTQSQGWLADTVSQHLGLPKPLTQGAISRWFAADTEPDLKTIGAVAAILEVDPGWLAFGAASAAPAPSHAER